jgi:NAD(P)-dependent dehydrogenase (short-subunit alcohol dehydrogenase family)
MKSQFNLKDQVVVITGGAGLLGSEFSKAIENSGAKVIIADINEQAANGVKEKVEEERKTKSNIDFVHMDITSESSVQNAIENVVSKYSKIDALINNAYPRNKNYGKKFFDVAYKDFCENIGLNLGGYFNTSKLFSKYFMQQGHGNIINIASIYGVIPPKFEIYKDTPMTMPVEYAAIKSGLIHLTKYMAKYLAGENIRVNALSPGGIFDSQAEDFVAAYNSHCTSKGILNPKDMIGGLLFLLSSESQFMNGQNLVIDDGFTL